MPSHGVRKPLPHSFVPFTPATAVALRTTGIARTKGGQRTDTREGAIPLRGKASQSRSLKMSRGLSKPGRGPETIRGCTEPNRARKVGDSQPCEPQVRGWCLPDIHTLLTNDFGHSIEQRGKG